MSRPGQDEDATDTDTADVDAGEAQVCSVEELFEHGGPVFQLFAELVEGAAVASRIPGYAVIAISPDGSMSSINGGHDEAARRLCGELAVSAGDELVRRVRAGKAAAARGRAN